MYVDRKDAGRQLAKRLQRFKDEDVVILAIPRGGLPLGAITAKELNAPLDVALSKKIGHPYNKEYAIGAVSLEHDILTDAIGVTKGYIEEEKARIREKLKQAHQQYYQKRNPQNLEDKTVIIIDDGVATGNTVLSTVALAQKQKAKKIIIAIPVGSASAVRSLKNNTSIHEVICLKTPVNFKAVGQFYESFPQISDEEAIQWFQGLKTN
jgi:predicted phosphoribosyltransferase